MIKILAGVAATTVITMTGCGQGVPQVDNPHNVVVNGEFLDQASTKP